jgi:hypothetical protein
MMPPFEKVYHWQAGEGFVPGSPFEMPQQDITVQLAVSAAALIVCAICVFASIDYSTDEFL